MKRRYHKVLFSFLFFTGLQQCVFAQTEEGKETVYFAMPLLSDTSISVGANNTLTYSNSGEDTARIKNITPAIIMANTNSFLLADTGRRLNKAR